MDKYDCEPHKMHFDDWKILNIGSRSNIEEKVKEFIKNVYHKQKIQGNDMESLYRSIMYCISQGRNALYVLESRHFTCVGLRVLHTWKVSETDYRNDWYLVNVWWG